MFMFVRSGSFKVLVFVLIIAILGTTNVTAQSIKQEKAPNWKNAKVTLEDLKSLKDYTIANGNAPLSLVSNEKLRGTLREELSQNSELTAFTGIKTPELRKAYANSIRIGKSLNKYDVYYVNFESANWTIIATYDIDRKLLLDAVFFDRTDANNVKVIDRNVGILFEGTLAELMTVKYGSPEEAAKIKAKQKNPLEKGKKGIAEKATSMLTIESASAGGFCGYDKNGNPLYSSEVCGWTSVVYCAAAGLLGFIPGLICSAVAMWGCTYQCN